VQPGPLGRQQVWQRVKSSNHVVVWAPCVLNVRFAHDVETGSVFEARGLGIVGFLGQVSVGVISKGCGSAIQDGLFSHTVFVVGFDRLRLLSARDLVLRKNITLIPPPNR